MAKPDRPSYIEAVSIAVYTDFRCSLSLRPGPAGHHIHHHDAPPPPPFPLLAPISRRGCQCSSGSFKV